MTISAGMLTLGTATANAQLSLRQSLRQADRAAYGNRIAAANAAAQSAQALASLKGILPSLHFETGYLRTTDPIGAFGATLRQRAISPANFDPQRLNFPSAIGNYQSGVVLEQPLFNADAWSGRRAAVHAAAASRISEEWTRLSIHVDIIRAYYGAILAVERANTLRSASRAAHAHVAQAESMLRQGLVTKSDALLAAVRAGDIDAQLAEAVGGAATARRQLAVALGGDGTDSLLELNTRLPSSEQIRSVVSADTAALPQQTRADLTAAAEGVAAARSDAIRARSAYLPHVNTFARYDWNSAARPYAGDRNWTVGLMALWSPFAGAGELADIHATGARVTAAEAQAEAVGATARLEVEQTRTALSVALARLDIAERAAAQSTEAHRLVGRKYEGGLAAVSELLDAQAAETQSALALSQARWSAIVADAERRRALGTDPATLAALDDGNAVAARDSLATP